MTISQKKNIGFKALVLKYLHSFIWAHSEAASKLLKLAQEDAIARVAATELLLFCFTVVNKFVVRSNSSIEPSSSWGDSAKLKVRSQMVVGAIIIEFVLPRHNCCS